jgi:hypothetical protein
MNITEISYHNTEDKNQATAVELNNMTGIYFDEKMKPVKPGKYAQQVQEIENVMNLTMKYLQKSSGLI